MNPQSPLPTQSQASQGMLAQSTRHYISRWERNFVSSVLGSQQKLIDDLKTTRERLDTQLIHLQEQLARLEGNEELRQVLERTNQELKNTVESVGARLIEEQQRLQEAGSQMSKLSNLMRLFLEFGDDNRGALMTFLDHNYQIRVTSRNFRPVIQNMLEALPPQEVDEVQAFMEQLALSDDLTN